MNTLKKAAAVASVAFLLSAPMIGMAQQTIPCQGGVCPPQVNITSVDRIFDIIRKIVGYLQALFWIAATLFIFYAAYLYLTAAGDPEKVGAAKNQLIYAVIAIAIALVAFSVPTIVGTFLQ
jgi:hypothetical protein